jgi:two-component system, NtrC family, response regulator AtoC
MDRLQSDSPPDVLLLNLGRSAGEDLHILRWVRRLRPDLGVIVTCHSQDSNPKNEALRLGAGAVLMRPVDDSELETAIRVMLNSQGTHVDLEVVSDAVDPAPEDEFFLSISRGMQGVRAQAELLARTDVPALILGEPGSGKATVARLIHRLSRRSEFDFYRVDCARKAPEELEAVLFGQRSVTTTWRNTQESLTGGKSGTLLLEEIANMSPALQFRLVEFLQETQANPSENARGVGGLRILAGSSVNLDQAVFEKRLREDLYHRLSAFTIQVPPLRKRKDEIEPLLRYSMYKFAMRYGVPPRPFSQRTLNACVNYPWPGNVSELGNFVKRYLLSREEQLGPQDHEESDLRYSSQNGDAKSSFLGAESLRIIEAPSLDSATSLKSLINGVKSAAERNAIAAALQKTRWNRKAAARLLRVSYRTLLYKIERYKMSASDPEPGVYPANGEISAASPMSSTRKAV